MTTTSTESSAGTTGVREVLIAARSLIAKPENWIKGHGILTTMDGFCYCATYAVIRGGRMTFAGDITVMHAHERLRRAIGLRKREVFQWNDQPSRTHSEVVAAFDKAIAISSNDGVA